MRIEPANKQSVELNHLYTITNLQISRFLVFSSAKKAVVNQAATPAESICFRQNAFPLQFMRMCLHQLNG